MSSSEPSLQSLWQELNLRFFRSCLPPIRIEWSSRLTASAGLFVCRVGPRQPPRPERDDCSRRRIRLSSVLLRRDESEWEQETRSTLAHEMIHQWQYDILKRRPNHGLDFRRMMARMNQEGLGITVYHSLGREVAALAKYAWRCQTCGDLYRRQRRSIHPRRHRCGACRGPLREVTPVQEDQTESLQLALSFHAR